MKSKIAVSKVYFITYLIGILLLFTKGVIFTITIAPSLIPIPINIISYFLWFILPTIYLVVLLGCKNKNQYGSLVNILVLLSAFSTQILPSIYNYTQYPTVLTNKETYDLFFDAHIILGIIGGIFIVSACIGLQLKIIKVYRESCIYSDNGFK